MMDEAEIAFIKEISTARDKRAEQLTSVIRVVHSLRGNVLEDTAAQMAIPMIYAQWEGFVKESLQMYIDFLGRRTLLQRDTHVAILAYSWTPSIKKLAANLAFEKQVEFTGRFLDALHGILAFGKLEQAVDTKSNLNATIMDGLFARLNLDASTLLGRRSQVNSLVHKRNDVAHGGRARDIEIDEIAKMSDLVNELMGYVETALREAVEEKRYLRTKADGQRHDEVAM